MCRGPLLGSSILAMGSSCKRGIYTCNGWQHVVKRTDAAATVQSDKWSPDIGIGQQPLSLFLLPQFFQRGCLTSWWKEGVGTWCGRLGALSANGGKCWKGRNPILSTSIDASFDKLLQCIPGRKSWELDQLYYIVPKMYESVSDSTMLFHSIQDPTIYVALASIL